jgi:hypothetical protein
LSFRPLQVPRADLLSLLSRELAVQLLDLLHQIEIKPSDLDASIHETPFPATTDRFVRIEHADDDARNSAFDDSLGAWALGAVSRCAWFKRRKEGRTRQRLVPELRF